MNLQVYNNTKNSMYKNVYGQYKEIYRYHPYSQYHTSYEEYLSNNINSQEELRNIGAGIEEYSRVYNFNEWYNEYYAVLENSVSRKDYDSVVLEDALILKSREEAYRAYVAANSGNYYQTVGSKIVSTLFKLGLVFIWWLVASIILFIMFEDLMMNWTTSVIVQFLLVLGPLVFIVKDLIKYFSEKEEKYRIYLERGKHIEAMRNAFYSYQSFVNQHPFLRSRNPVDATSEILYTLKSYFDQGRADNLKEAQNLLAEEMHREAMIQKQDEIIMTQEEIRGRIEENNRLQAHNNELMKENNLQQSITNKKLHDISRSLRR